MAALKIKKVRRHEYYYWRKSRRSNKRFGGDGRVRSLDYLIGTTPVGRWLAFYFWSGEAELREYVQAVVKHLCPGEWSKLVEVSIDWQERKVRIKSKFRGLDCFWFGDCRSRYWQKQRKALQSWVDRIIEQSTQINDLIQNAAYLLGEHYRCSKVVEQLRQKAREARLCPDNFVLNAEDILDECAHANHCRSDQAMDYYLQRIELLEQFAPRSKRSQFRHQIISQIERLAKDRAWLEAYEARLERSPSD
ncbi:MAG: hypothetical protein ICV63_11770, partial [Coleofasciculus sp. Co-bin14]|nr:hypothetical protein [Coleofasciculus sp. Co-bin14]